MQDGGFIPNCQPVHVAELAKKTGDEHMSGIIMNYKFFSLYRGHSLNSVAKGGIKRGLSYKRACGMTYPKVGLVPRTLFDRDPSQTGEPQAQVPEYDVRLQKNGRRVFTIKTHR